MSGYNRDDHTIVTLHSLHVIARSMLYTLSKPRRQSQVVLIFETRLANPNSTSVSQLYSVLFSSDQAPPGIVNWYKLALVFLVARA